MNRYPRPRSTPDYEALLVAERVAHSITRKELAAAYGELAEARRPAQLDVEIEALKKQRDVLLAAIEFTLEYQRDLEWLRAWTEGDADAMAELDTWIARNGTP